MKQGIASGKLKGTKEVKEEKELKLLDGVDRIDYRRDKDARYK